MGPFLRRLAGATTIVATALIAFPAGVAADCNGPTCGEVGETAVEGLGLVALIVILVVFVTVMAAAEVRRR